MNFSQINFGFFALKIYGAFISLAFAVASWHYYKQLSKLGFSKDFFLHHYWRWLLGGLLLGRLLATLLEPGLFDRFGSMSFFAFWDGEINFWGAGLGFLLTMYIDLKKAQKPMGPWLDAGVGSFLMAVLIADLAAFLTGHVYGSETHLPWGVQYETFGVEILNPVHPITLYGFFFHGLLLWWVRRHQQAWQKTPGLLAARAGLLFLLIDFVLQFLRGNSLWVLWGLNLSQYMALLASFALVYWLYENKALELPMEKRTRKRRP